MRRVQTWLVAVIVVAGMVVGIAVARISGVWVTESTKVPVRIASGEFAGEYDPADIRGSYTLGDIGAAFDIPVDVLVTVFGVEVEGDPSEYRINELEETFGALPDGGEVGTDSVRLFVSLYTGLPHIPEETTRLPGPALRILEERLSPADIEMVQAITVSLADLRAAVVTEADAGSEAAEAESFAATEEHVTEEGTIRGQTTFNDLLSWGLTQEQIEEVMGVEMGTRATILRDYLSERGLSFGEIRTDLQALLDAMP